jgi:integrase
MAINKTVAGTFEVDFRDQYKKRHLKTFDTKKEAVAFRDEVRALVQKREYVPPANTTVKDAADTWYQKRITESYARSALVYWKNHIDHYIVPSLGSYKITDVTVQAIEKAATDWNVKLAPQTVNKVLGTLTNIFALAKRYKMRLDNPCTEALRLKLATKDEDGAVVDREQVYSAEELGKLIRATESGTKDRIIVMLPALTGIRIGEQLALSWSAVDLKAGTLHVRQSLADSDAGEDPIFKEPKRKSSRRTIGLPQELISELRVWKLKCPHSERDLVLPTSDGFPMCRRVTQDALDRAIAGAGIKRLTHHQLRHSFASNLIAGGADFPEVARLMGHKNASTTIKVYTHFVPRKTNTMQDFASSVMAGS